LASPATATAVAATLADALGSTPLVLPGGPEEVRTVAVVSGAAARDVREAAALGIDLFVTGEPEEDAPYLARELGVTIVAAGHNATETVGVRAVAARLAEVFGIDTGFIPVWNPV
jgi:putative NIF3 family GTP cyclohydrolase 1 type 2